MRFLHNPEIFVRPGLRNKGRSAPHLFTVYTRTACSCQCWASSLLTEEIQHADNICAPFLSDHFIIVFPNITCYLVHIWNDEWSNKKGEKNDIIFGIRFFSFFSVRVHNSLFSFQTIWNSIGGIGLLDLSYCFLSSSSCQSSASTRRERTFKRIIK